jgi:hypothetical protein|eukprot:31018-Pelagococcus_subviridis.AAC.14
MNGELARVVVDATIFFVRAPPSAISPPALKRPRRARSARGFALAAVVTHAMTLLGVIGLARGSSSRVENGGGKP